MASNERLLNAAVAIAVLGMLVTTGIAIKREFFPSLAVASTVPNQEQNRKVDRWAELIAKGHRFGPPDAQVTILEFGDFECPACKGFFTDVERIRARNPSKIALVFRHFPLRYHRFAYPSARASECAGLQGRFEKFYRVLYGTQDSLGLIPFHQLAMRSGVSDLVEFDRCLEKPGTVGAVEADIADARAIQVRGTPAVVVNGILFAQTPSAAQLDELVK